MGAQGVGENAESEQVKMFKGGLNAEKKTVKRNWRSLLLSMRKWREQNQNRA